MSSLVILFVALSAVLGLSNKVGSSTVQALDLNKILKLVQRQRHNTDRFRPKQHKLRLRFVSSDSDSDSDSDDSLTDLDESDDYDRLARLRKERIVDLLESVANEKTNNDRLTHRKGKKNLGQTLDKSDDSNKLLAKERVHDLLESVANGDTKTDRITNRLEKPTYRQKSYLVGGQNINAGNNVQKQILEKLFSKTSNEEEPKPKPKKQRLTPNRLTPTVTMDDVKKYFENKNKDDVLKYYEKTNDSDETTALENYSKVYIVLNPQAVRNSKNKNSLNDLISKVISLSSLTSKRDPQDKKTLRYKGFLFNEANSKRRFRAINDNFSRFRDDEIKFVPLGTSWSGITAM